MSLAAFLGIFALSTFLASVAAVWVFLTGAVKGIEEALGAIVPAIVAGIFVFGTSFWVMMP